MQRLSASVFAIRLSLEQSVVYQGIFKLLTDGADRIVTELKNLVQQIKSSYGTAVEFVRELGNLAEKGTRFAKLIAEFLNKAFLQADAKEEIVVTMRVQISHQSEAILAASVDLGGIVVLASKKGNAWNVDPSTGRVTRRYRLSDRPVFALAHLDDEDFAVGTDDGVEVGDYTSSYRERVTCIAVAPWGAKGSHGAIITGSKDGVVRRLTLAGRLSQVSEQSYERVGRCVQCLAINGHEVIAATGAELVFLDPDMRTKRTMRVPFDVTAMDVVDQDTLILCGDGHITHVNLASGSYSRVITASNNAKYCCVAACDAGTFYFGTENGRVGVMSHASGEELGSVDVGFPLRGIVPMKQKKIIAYGGEWSSRGRSAAILTVDTVTRAIVNRG